MTHITYIYIWVLLEVQEGYINTNKTEEQNKSLIEEF